MTETSSDTKWYGTTVLCLYYVYYACAMPVLCLLCLYYACTMPTMPVLCLYYACTMSTIFVLCLLCLYYVYHAYYTCTMPVLCLLCLYLCTMLTMPIYNHRHSFTGTRCCYIQDGLNISSERFSKSFVALSTKLHHIGFYW